MSKYTSAYDMDDPMRTMEHGQIIKSKKMLFQLYQQWYNRFLALIPKLPNQIYVELGSGGGFFKEVAPSVICSDVIPLASNDKTFSALDMPFDDHSLGGIFMIDTLHHIPDAEQFLREADRTLELGGKIAMIEPANSLWGRFIYQNFHHEAFNPKGDWTIPFTGPLSGANGALPWIVFERDQPKYNELFPNLKIEKINYINPLIYLISGGVSRSAFLPNFTYPFIKFIDKILPKISKQFSMFMYIEITKIT